MKHEINILKKKSISAVVLSVLMLLFVFAGTMPAYAENDALKDMFTDGTTVTLYFFCNARDSNESGAFNVASTYHDDGASGAEFNLMYNMGDPVDDAEYSAHRDGNTLVIKAERNGSELFNVMLDADDGSCSLHFGKGIDSSRLEIGAVYVGENNVTEDVLPPIITGSVISSGNIWIILVVLVIAVAAAAVIIRRKKARA